MTTDPAPVSPAQRNPQNLDFPTGPEVGEPFPDFTLNNQRGAAINLSAARNSAPAIIVFERSARW